VAHATTDASGSFRASFRVPASASPGVETVVATGQTSGLQASTPFTVRTNWSKFHFDAANTGLNPFENVVGLSNVSGLGTAWIGAAGGSGASPIVADGIAYVSSEDGVDAYVAGGTDGCSCTPKTCQALWTDTLGPVNGSTPAVSAGVLYVGSSNGRLYAFDAHGVTNCSGTPKTCGPLWTSGDLRIYGSSPAVSGGTVYVAGGAQGAKLYAFDAAGVTNCSGTPKVCTPLWTGALSGKSNLFSSPAVSNGVAYIGSLTNDGGGFDAFDAAGVTNCSGTPKVCTPLWTATTGSISHSSPAVAGGMVYIASDNRALFAFDAAGVTNCHGTAPKTCSALWTAATNDALYTPAVADGVLYTGSLNGLHAYDATGATNCTGVAPKRCSPLWTGSTGGLPATSDPAVANGGLYVGSQGLYAFDAAGVVSCSGTPKTCDPVWTGATGGAFVRSPAVANGIVYVSASDQRLYAFSLS
jgi:outer membrane protein assembly factor BamB